MNIYDGGFSNMKKIIALSLAALLAFSIVGCGKEDATDLGDNEELVVEADVQVYEDFEYSVNEEGNYEIVGYTYNGEAAKAVVIPDAIEGRPVTGIGNDAFKAVATVNAVTIPDSIKYIGNFAFYGCTGLTEVVLPDSVTAIGTGAFWGCTEMTKITISNHLTAIGDYAFWNCTKLAAVTLPESLKTIGEGAFWGCEALTEISVPKFVEEIGRAAFMYSKNLAKVTFANATVKLGEKAFDSCAATLSFVGASESTAAEYAAKEGVTFTVAQ